MKQSLSYENCYKLLNINSNCNWKELKKAYRVLVHKWHPDRCEDDDEKALTTDKLKDLNAAFKQLSEHYNKYGELPPLSPPVQTAPPLPVEDKKDPVFTKKTKVTPIKEQKKYLQSIFKFAVVVATMIIIYPYLNSFVISMAAEINSVDEDLPNNKKNTINNKSNINKKIIIETNIEYFTYGSTLGEVILIQGPPDKTIDDIWFYGKSEIHFKDGLVIKWLRTANNPLKAQAITR